VQERPDAIFVGGDRFLYANRLEVVKFATRTRIPLMGQNRDFTEAGALMSYSSPNDAYAQATASYVDRLLKGARPSELPFQRPTRFELVINLKSSAT
jgi:putative ABC transport system substrate-binding protein